MRAYDPRDGDAVVDLVVAAGMFGREEAGFLADGALHEGTTARPASWRTPRDGHGLASVLPHRPEEAADRPST